MYPGLDNDKIKVHLRTHFLPALPSSFNDEAHFTLLDEVYEALSTAVDQRTQIEFAELLRWQRLHDELEELFVNRIVAELDRRGSLKLNPKGRSEIPADDAANKLHKMRKSFVTLVEEYQKTISSPSKTAEFQALIGDFRSNRSPSFSTPPSYEAVSYCCGNQRPKTRIVLNDCSVDVPATAAHALRGLRNKDGMRILWIDALCID